MHLSVVWHPSVSLASVSSNRETSGVTLTCEKQQRVHSEPSGDQSAQGTFNDRSRRRPFAMSFVKQEPQFG